MSAGDVALVDSHAHLDFGQFHGRIAEVLENAAPFHHLEDPLADDPMGGQPRQIAPPVLNAAGGDGPVLEGQQPGNGLEGGGFARTVGAQQGHDGPLRDAQGEALEDQDHLVVDHLDIVDFKQDRQTRLLTWVKVPMDNRYRLHRHQHRHQHRHRKRSTSPGSGAVSIPIPIVNPMRSIRWQD